MAEENVQMQPKRPRTSPIDSSELTLDVLETTPGNQDNEMLVVVLEAKSALEGTHPNPEEALNRFIEIFGEEELQSLQEQVILEMDQAQASVTSPMEEDMSISEFSDGMSDSIPANIDGQEDIRVSEGEYIVDSSTVSDLGNGDTNSGAARLDDMVKKIRAARHGTVDQPPAINPEDLLLG
jgi:hypothetical protein